MTLAYFSLRIFCTFYNCVKVAASWVGRRWVGVPIAVMGSVPIDCNMGSSMGSGDLFSASK